MAQNIFKGANNSREKKDVGVKKYTDSSFVLTVASIITISSKGCVTPVNENSVATELHKGQWISKAYYEVLDFSKTRIKLTQDTILSVLHSFWVSFVCFLEESKTS